MGYIGSEGEDVDKGEGWRGLIMGYTKVVELDFGLVQRRDGMTVFVISLQQQFQRLTPTRLIKIQRTKMAYTFLKHHSRIK